MRNNISDVRSQYGRKTIDLTVFHGSEQLFAFAQVHTSYSVDIYFAF
jgi:hypothetical protein